MPVGRPTKYKPEFCDLVVEMGKEGKSLCQMACAMDITEETLSQWRKSKPAFSESLKRARQYSQAWWEDHGQKGSIGLIEGFNATSYVWQTKNRFPASFRDKHEIDHNVSGEIIVEIGGSVDED